MHVHLIGVAGTGMGSFAGLLRALGHRVTGSDTAFHPPMGDALRAYGIETMSGYDPSHLDPAPDLVVVGNVCRPNNPEARAALDRGLTVRSFPKAYAELVLRERRSLVIAGTHGKSTTTALTAYLLDAMELDPTFLVGAVAKNYDASFRLGRGGVCVTEGDEYDSAFFEKIPKCWSYRPWGAVLTSVEHDHIDIYPTEQTYLDAFRGFLARMAPDGVLVAYAGDPKVVELAKSAPCRTVFYAKTGDALPPGVTPAWEVASIAPTGGWQPFELFLGGSCAGRFLSPLIGDHNLRNTAAALCLLAEGLSLPVAQMAKHLQGFRGLKRRQELVATADGVRVYDDFAHHPTAVDVTLSALRAHHPAGRLFALFEPRSATACRRLHQDAYAQAFSAADVTLLAPVGRMDIPEAERLDVPLLVEALRAKGRDAATVPAGEGSVDALVSLVARDARPGDTVAVLSNGAFGGVHQKLAAALAARGAR